MDESTKTRISSKPLLVDHYEQQYVYVEKSPIEGEGLFAKVDIPAGLVVSFYNGIRITHKSVFILHNSVLRTIKFLFFLLNVD